MGALEIAIGGGDDREAKLSLVRKLMLALKKDDEHAALDALEDLYAECGRGDEPTDDGED